MESSALELITEIGPQHHLVVNEEGIVQFTDDGEELLVYDDLTSALVRVPSCPVSWKHFGLELQPNNTITSVLKPINPDPLPVPDSAVSQSNLNEEIKIKVELDDEVETTVTTIQTAKEVKFNKFKQKIQNQVLRDAWEELRKNTSPKQPKKRKPKPSKSPAKTNRSGDLFREHFDIKKFSPEEQIMEFEKRKFNRQKYLERLYKCQTCYRGFQLQENYAKHMLAHMVQTKYYCAICRLYLETKNIYHTHMNQHKQKFLCKHCDFESYHRASSSLHARAHSINLPQSFQTFMNHANIGKRARHCCVICGFSFVNEVGLKLHEKRTHKDNVVIPDNGPVCTLCDIMFATEAAFIMHCRIMHNEYEIIRTDTEEEYLYAQPPSPSMETTVTLESADYTIPTNTGSLQNDELETSRFYTRTGDNQTDTHFSIHMNGHDYNDDGNQTESIIGDEDEKELMCEICQRMFSDPIVLYRHVHSHKYAIRLKQQSRRPECPQCGMTFSSFSNRLRHIKYAHTEVRPSICDMCNKGFKSEPELKSHIDHVHLKKPWPKRNRRGGLGREGSPF